MSPDGLILLGMCFSDENTMEMDVFGGVLRCVFNDDGYMYSEFGVDGVFKDVPIVRLSDVGVISRVFGKL